MYKLAIMYGIVSEWTEEGQGKTLHTKDMGLRTTMEEFSLDDIQLAVNTLMGTEIQVDDFWFGNGEHGQFSIIEDDDGNPAEEGRYLVDYTFMVEQLNPAIDLEAYFTERRTKDEIDPYRGGEEA